ncbi:MAG: NADH-quinone oxidoreductase subunit C [Chthoniobacterales bacterium]|nr:NADH-quinone oxidoreductase subunit C [Chthoniobacterales bacterium]
MTEILEAIQSAFPSADVGILTNPSPCAQHSLLVAGKDALDVAKFLRDGLGYDFCSNVSGVDWPPKKVREVVVRKETVDGVESEVKETIEREVPGYLEVVYHLFSIAKRLGPVILRLRTGNRSDEVSLPSLTPVWKSADFQEREIYDLYGIHFEGHPDLRRLLMWEEFTDYPMRKDYVAPDDYEYEPTPHDEILAKVGPPKEVA